MPWSDEEEDLSSNSSSPSDSEAEDGVAKKKANDQSKAGQASKERSKGNRDNNG